MRSPKFYILQDRRPVAIDSVDDWAVWMNDSDRKVAYTKIDNDVAVSTVFLGLDHQYGNGPPLLFETMIFGGPLDNKCWRYSSWDDAEIGHQAAVRKARQGFDERARTD
jgi:hypothetical protein